MRILPYKRGPYSTQIVAMKELPESVTLSSPESKPNYASSFVAPFLLFFLAP